MVHGGNAVAGFGAERSAERRVRQWEQAELEFRNGRRFHNMLVEGATRLEKRSAGDKQKRRRGRDGKERMVEDARAGGSRPPSRPGSRGRVRFEVGRRDADDDDDGEEEEEDGGVEGLLRRMWDGGDTGPGGED